MSLPVFVLNPATLFCPFRSPLSVGSGNAAVSVAWARACASCSRATVSCGLCASAVSTACRRVSVSAGGVGLRPCACAGIASNVPTATNQTLECVTMPLPPEWNGPRTGPSGARSRRRAGRLRASLRLFLECPGDYATERLGVCWWSARGGARRRTFGGAGPRDDGGWSKRHAAEVRLGLRGPGNDERPGVLTENAGELVVEDGTAIGVAALERDRRRTGFTGVRDADHRRPCDLNEQEQGGQCRLQPTAARPRTGHRSPTTFGARGSFRRTTGAARASGGHGAPGRRLWASR